MILRWMWFIFGFFFLNYKVVLEYRKCFLSLWLLFVVKREKGKVKIYYFRWLNEKGICKFRKGFVRKVLVYSEFFFFLGNL